MRFGIVTPHVRFADGQGRVNFEIAAEVVRQGHEVLLFAEKVDDTVLSLPRCFMVLSPSPNWLPSRLLRDPVFAWRTDLRLRDATNRCDALLANGFVSWGRSDVNAVHFVHGSWIHSPAHPWQLQHNMRSFYQVVYSRVNATLEKRVLRRCCRVVAVSAKVRDELIRIGVSAQRIEVIVNGVDAEEFHPGPPERARFGLPNAATMALFAGDLKTPRKNLETVLRAMSEVPELHLAVAGRTEGAVYPALARSLGLHGRVHFIGFQTDMPSLMRSVDLFVFPSRYEACSLVLLEAMASGLPVIAAHTAGGAELITPDAGTILDDSEDYHALAAAMRPIVMNVSCRQAMAKAARQHALNHSWRSMAARYVDLLLETGQTRQEMEHRRTSWPRWPERLSSAAGLSKRR